MKLTDEKKRYIAVAAYEGIAKSNVRELQNQMEHLRYEIKVEFDKFIREKVQSVKIDPLLKGWGFFSDHERDLSVLDCEIYIQRRGTVFGRGVAIKDTSPTELLPVPQQQITTPVGNSNITNVNMDYVSSALTERLDELKKRVAEHNEEQRTLSNTIEAPLRASDTLAKLLEVWPSAKMLIPQQWYREEEERKQRERERREAAKRARILREQREALKIEEQRADMSDIDTALLTARMQGDIS